MPARTLRQWAGLKPPQALDFATTALILIDFQLEYFNSRKLLVAGAIGAAEQAAALVQHADRNGMPVIHIQHVADNPKSALFARGSADGEIVALLRPSDEHALIEKPLPSSFVRTRLEAILRERGIETVILAGFATHMCVDATARDAVSLGYRVIVVHDACGSRDLPAIDGTIIPALQVHETALAALADRFCDVLGLDEVVALAGVPCADSAQPRTGSPLAV